MNNCPKLQFMFLNNAYVSTMVLGACVTLAHFPWLQVPEPQIPKPQNNSYLQFQVMTTVKGSALELESRKRKINVNS